ncbi:porin, partial [Salmonella enterica subsp. enterica serovar Anatum]|nr:porin [Salmonella enterica subsp. enterica serovar Anatum]
GCHLVVLAGNHDSVATLNESRDILAFLNTTVIASAGYAPRLLYDIGAWTDVLPEFGGDTWTQTDVFMTQRATGVATYRNTDFFG